MMVRLMASGSPRKQDLSTLPRRSPRRGLLLPLTLPLLRLFAAFHQGSRLRRVLRQKPAAVVEDAGSILPAHVLEPLQIPEANRSGLRGRRPPAGYLELFAQVVQQVKPVMNDVRLVH